LLYYDGHDGRVKTVEGTWYSCMPTISVMTVAEWNEMKTWLLFALPATTPFTLTGMETEW